MSEDKPNPVNDLKQGLGLLFRAAKGAVEQLPTDKIEEAVKEGAKEVGKAFESIGNEIDKVFHKTADKPAPSSHQPPPAPPAREANEAKKEEPYDDAYAPEPPKGPRVG
ncbi:hypothetical protein AKJ09_10490 [Labilithrix luteola]|uniref:Uncharacterized protein n=1 Tax=Labilithrix luteola TaxID=1391654 RepID=A0A0K1QDU9_9BACT|nr:hypothetical protein [Labilithrix luteola]AKV03827.1 hypothetical protein AKJ09_10490 [Labilithrix luteola]